MKLRFNHFKKLFKLQNTNLYSRKGLLHFLKKIYHLSKKKLQNTNQNKVFQTTNKIRQFII